MERILVYGMTDNPGGIESYLLEMSMKMKNYGIQFDFVSDFPTVAYADKLKQNGSRLYFIPAKRKKLFTHLGAMRKLLRDHPEYQTLYFNILDAGAAITVSVPWLMRKKIVVHSHNGSTEKVCLHRMCRPFLNMMTDQRAACSWLAAKYMFGKSVTEDKSILIVPNTIDAEKYDFNEAIRKRYRKEMGLEGNYVVCHVGRMTEQKNPYRLIDIFSALYECQENVVLLYAGTGELKDEVEAYGRKQKCADRIRFLGVRSDISELMQASDVFLLPSLYEGLPIVAIEAQTAGLPLVLSDRITKETDLTGNIEFISLDRENRFWAEQILKYRCFERKGCREKIRAAGYDKGSITETLKKLVDFFGGNNCE